MRWWSLSFASTSVPRVCKLQNHQVDRKASTDMSTGAAARSPWTGLSQFLPTTQKLLEFSNAEVEPFPSINILLVPSISVQQGPKKGDRIVYVAGAFDLFHIGHLAFLEKCREHGDYLIVGLHTDPVVNRWQKGPLATSSGTRGPITPSWTCTRERSPPWPTAVSMRS